jgi:tetratricopeptide (TPR) repeat protein
MKKKSAWTLFVAFWCVVFVAGWTREQVATSSTTQAIDRLIRSTRRGAEDRAPFVLEEAPAEASDSASLRDDDDIENAIVLMQEKDYAAAVPLLEASIKRLPTIEAIWEALGWSYYHTGRPEEAERLWLQYLNLRPDSAKAYSLLAQLALLKSDWNEADRYLSGSVRLDPQSFDIRYWYAQNLFRLGRLEPAVAIFEKLVEEDEYRFDVKIDLARIYTLVQRYEDSLDLWSEVVAEIPGNLDFRTDYARALMLVGGLEEADYEAKRILEEDPTRWPVMNLRADVAELSQQPEQMVESLRKLLDESEDGEVKARMHVRLGARLVVLGRKDPKNWPLTMAMAEYEKAIEIIPTYVPWLNQYAQIALGAQQNEKARRMANNILKEFNPLNHQALRTLFEVEMAEKNFDAAEEAMNRVYDNYQPANPYRDLDLARIEIQRGRYQNAMDALDRLEEAGNHAVFTLIYHGLTESEWMALTSTRRLYEHLVALRNEGYRFIAPTDIPAYLESGQRRLPGRESKPWLARLVDNVKYAFTGKREELATEDVRPAKVAVVTFDDGLRTSFQLGTPIAKDLGIVFGMHVITHLEELNAPMYAAWEEVRAAQESGGWEIASHLMYANTDRPTGPEPEPKVFNLPNRIWLPERNRIETLREWSARIRRDFEESRRLIEHHLGLPKGAPMAVAYPYSEIGQEEGSNVAQIINPIRAILNEAAREYQVGFVVGGFGYTMPGDNPFMVRRYEPGWDEDAQKVVEAAYANHPTFMARRMRAEIATLMDLPYLAEKQIELLQRDGYPEHLVRELVNFTQNRIPGDGPAADLAESDRKGTSRARIRPSNLYVSGSYRENQSNEQIRQDQIEFRAGFNLNLLVGVEAAYLAGTIDQSTTSNYWFETTKSETTSSVETRSETVDGTNSVSTVVVESTTTRPVQTNRQETYEYTADVEEIRGALTIRINDHATLVGTLGQKTLKLKGGYLLEAETYEEMVGSLAMSWRPYRALSVVASYYRDLTPSARAKILYDSIAMNVNWKVSDGWDMGGDARYMSLEDKNAMVMLAGRSFWNIFPRQGVWAGLESSVYSMDEDSDLYWSPYWDFRYAGVLRLSRAYQNYYFEFDARLGQQKEKARPADVNEWLGLDAQAQKDGTWSAGEPPGAPWDTFVGIGATYRQRIWRYFDLFGSLSVNFLRDYSEHDFTIGLQASF